MRARLGWALLLLAAVFTMHGLQCTAAEPAAATSPEHGVAMEMAAADGQASPGTAEREAHVVAPVHAASGEAPAGLSAAVHALMVCLAVLAGGIGVAMAALAAWLARGRARTTARRATGAVGAAVNRYRPLLAAPELARLCALRI